MDGKPPSCKTNVGLGARFLSADGALARRFKSIRALWASDWDIPVTRGNVSYRRHFISTDISKEG